MIVESSAGEKPKLKILLPQTESKMNHPQLYETDFYAWAQEQVGLLKTQQWARLDTVNLVEEIEALGRKKRQELRNRLEYC